ncbi:MAG: hypothetical protein CMP47_12510 [Rickettsiales bacterium]|nr:hypothetical protein [Rickettsiales bacterium]|tara:strand:+ start:3143 stop:3907 length:765 start_codon:yes stop_codon:yes gene_type:complete
MKIGIIGHGFVGKSISTLYARHEQIIVDLDTQHTARDTSVCDIVFVCLPTPTKNSVCDYTVLLNALAELSHLDVPVVVKSTVTPDFFEHDTVKQIKHLVYYPEFLREAHYEYDAKHPDFVLLAGSPDDINAVKHAIVESDIQTVPVCYTTDSFRAASLAKYSINSFLATKVVFMNELQELAGNDFQAVAHMMSLDTRIGNTHLDVPGPDGQYGFGGSCFPKDTEALTSYAKQHNIQLSVLKQACETNDRLRNKK